MKFDNRNFSIVQGCGDREREFTMNLQHGVERAMSGCVGIAGAMSGSE